MCEEDVAATARIEEVLPRRAVVAVIGKHTRLAIELIGPI
jgi:hypothetical protein